MSTRTERLPVAPMNLVAFGLAAIAAVASVATGNPWGGLFIFIAGAYVVIAARLARRSDSTDLIRINALEYRDERDRTLARDGLATVGGAALLLGFVEFIVAIAVGEPAFILLASAQVVAIAIVWGVANARAVRRG